MKSSSVAFVSLVVVLIAPGALLNLNTSAGTPVDAGLPSRKTLSRAGAPAAITIDYPEDKPIFPPEITSPTFIWHDAEKAAMTWRIDVSFADGSAAIHAIARGERMRIRKIDPDCVAETNELPRLTPRQATARTWTPPAATWESIKKHSVAGPATLTITGFDSARLAHALSLGHVTIRTSRDPVGAPIFYRDVPLMPTETEKGVIEPIALSAVRLVTWKLRDIGEARSRMVMGNVPMCANCHSFSGDGRTLGMDMDGLQHNRGMYILAPVKPETSIQTGEVIQWRTSRDELRGNVRVGFMSQVSPDSRYVVTTINDAALNGTRRPSSLSFAENIPSNYYVANFKDYKFLQVFYPTRGVLCWYSRATGILQPLPGADDPRLVQMGAVWSPDSKYVVFARADAKDPNPEGAPTAKFAGDPNELQIQYDLYRIPFNEGRGGTPEPIEGASHNGMSNSFPKVSPDGRWIVFVESRDGMLMRPDSRLYIVPATGGRSRRMRCNMTLMNSWHSFSPNGRWLVFSSKNRSPYTQMYLTHIDEEGNDSPAILVDNATASNRAVNLPEFVNVKPGGLQHIDGPAIEFYRLFDRAAYLQKSGQIEESIAEYRKVLEINPNEALAHNNLSMVLLLAGRPQDAAAEFQKATEINLRRAIEIEPDHAPSYNELGMLLMRTGRVDEAVAQFRKVTELKPDFAPAHCNLGGALAKKGKFDGAVGELNKALALDPAYAPTYYNQGLVFSMRGETEKAITQWQKALEVDPKYVEAHVSLADALYRQGNAAEALAHWRQSLLLRPNEVSNLQRAAWVLATLPDPSIRNGSEALALARRAVQLTSGKDPVTLDTLAAAYAETGRFADAAQTARTALELAARANNEAVVEALKSRIALYDAGKPFRSAPARR
jgi:tetratricopeptide (TPR) repeat protein